EGYSSPLATQASVLNLLNNQLAQVSVVDTSAADASVALPLSTTSRLCIYKASGLDAVLVSPQGTDTLDGGTTPVTIASGKSGIFAVTAPGVWVTLAKALA